MFAEIFTLSIGIILVVFLAEIAVRHSMALADHYGLTGTFVGLTLLSVGTSIPEIMSHVVGSYEILVFPDMYIPLSGILIGASIGSDIFQQCIILSLVGIFGMIVVSRKNLFSEIGVLVGTTILVLIFALNGVITHLEGGILFACYLGYVYYLKTHNLEGHVTMKRLSTLNHGMSWILVFSCFALIGFITRYVLEAATHMVDVLPISASLFGVVLLGVASALPELTTSLVAILKKKADISAGILIGSNITNPLFGIGAGAIISSYAIPSVVVFFDLPVKIFTALLLFFYLRDGHSLRKWQAFSLIGMYVLYLYVRSMYFPVDV